MKTEEKSKGSPELLEKLAELEHIQWIAWSSPLVEAAHTTCDGWIILDPARISRWRFLVRKSYSQLTEEEKEKDRVWAKKALEVIEKYGHKREWEHDSCHE